MNTENLITEYNSEDPHSDQSILYQKLLKIILDKFEAPVIATLEKLDSNYRYLFHLKSFNVNGERTLSPESILDLLNQDDKFQKFEDAFIKEINERIDKLHG
jgi:hypothetical protein